MSDEAPPSSEPPPAPAPESAPAPAPAVTILDNRRIPCAVGLIRAEAMLSRLATGEILEIHTRDRFAPVEIPLWAVRSGHSQPTERRVGTWPWRYWVFTTIARGGTPTAE